jgi:hypothetical protein
LFIQSIIQDKTVDDSYANPSFRNSGAGAQWKNFFEPISAVDGLSVGNICLMFIVDIGMYMLLTLYFECIMPSKYGIRRPWYFLLKVN